MSKIENDAYDYFPTNRAKKCHRLPKVSVHSELVLKSRSYILRISFIHEIIFTVWLLYDLNYILLGLIHRLPGWLKQWWIHLQCRRPGLDPWVRKIPWRRVWQPTPIFLPRESPWTEEPGGLQSRRSQRVGHDWVTKHTYRPNTIFFHSFSVSRLYYLKTMTFSYVRWQKKTQERVKVYQRTQFCHN